jgi:SAM-dependent methyltransferase
MTLSVLDNLAPQPSASRAMENYRAMAPGYDTTCTRIEGLRLATVQALALQPGEIVFDIACGTGPTLPLLAELVGPAGRVVGIELSPEMAAQARSRVAVQVNCGHVTVRQNAMADMDDGDKADAVLMCYAHDVLQSEASVDRLIATAKPGARIALVGMQTLPWLWGWPVNLFNLYRARRYLTTYANMDRPWRLLAERGARLRLVRTALWGSAYLVVGTLPDI